MQDERKLWACVNGSFNLSFKIWKRCVIFFGQDILLESVEVPVSQAGTPKYGGNSHKMCYCMFAFDRSEVFRDVGQCRVLI